MKKGGHYIAILHFFANSEKILVPSESPQRGEGVYYGFRILGAAVAEIFAFQGTKSQFLALFVVCT